RKAIFALEFDVGQQQEIAHGDPDLGEDGVFGSAQEGFDLEVLLDPLEEGFDLPAGLIDASDGGSGKSEVVGQEFEDAVIIGIVVADQAQRKREVSMAVKHVELNRLVGQNGFIFGQILLSGDGVVQVGLGAGDEEGAGLVYPTEKLEVEEA